LNKDESYFPAIGLQPNLEGQVKEKSIATGFSPLKREDAYCLRVGFSPKQWSEEKVYKLKKLIKNRRRADFVY